MGAERANDAAFPFAELLGMSVELGPRGTAAAEVDATGTLHNPHGVAHGAVLFALADTSMGAATMSVLDGGQRCSTIELQLRFLRSVRHGRVRAETRVVQTGRRVVQLESRLHDDGGRLVATATGSFAVFDP